MHWFRSDRRLTGRIPRSKWSPVGPRGASSEPTCYTIVVVISCKWPYWRYVPCNLLKVDASKHKPHFLRCNHFR
jgi:hypothetical protein